MYCILFATFLLLNIQLLLRKVNKRIKRTDKKDKHPKIVTEFILDLLITSQN